MMHTIASSANRSFHAMRFVGVALTFLAASAGAAHAASPSLGRSGHGIDSSSLLSAVTLVIAGLLMMHDTVRQR